MTEPLHEYFIRLLIALAVGGIVGLEREFHGKPAGIRTNMLMCFGSCLIMIISIELARTTARTADPGRIAAQVVTGVGFLCAGTIMRSRFTVSGLTTAATIWVLSALGLGIGAGYITLSVLGAALVTVILVFLRYVEEFLARFHATHIVQLVLDEKDGIIASVLHLFTEMKITSEVLDINLEEGRWTATLEYEAPKRQHVGMIKKLSETEGIRSVTELRHTF